jgi:DNA-binding beta-propeller fold protein YncE
VTLTVSVPPVEYAYVVNSLAGTISEFNVGSGGALTAMNFITTGNNPQGIAIDPTSRYVYVANTNDNTLSEYAVGAGGVLASIGTVATGLSPSAIAIDPTGSYVYVTNDGDQTVSEYTIGTGGGLTLVGNHVYGVTSVVVFDSTAPYVYLQPSGVNSVSQYAVGAGGTLSFVSGAVTGAALSTIPIPELPAALPTWLEPCRVPMMTTSLKSEGFDSRDFESGTWPARAPTAGEVWIESGPRLMRIAPLGWTFTTS